MANLQPEIYAKIEEGNNIKEQKRIEDEQKKKEMWEKFHKRFADMKEKNNGKSSNNFESQPEVSENNNQKEV